MLFERGLLVARLGALQVFKRKQHTLASSVPVSHKVKEILSQGNIFADFTLLANKHGAMNLGQGFPSFGSPSFLSSTLNEVAQGDIFQADGSAPENLHNQYTKPGGDPLFSEILCQDYSSRFKRDLKPENICTTVGAQEAIFTALSTFTNPGDEIVVITPAFDSYFKSASVCGLEVKSCPMVCDADQPTAAGQYRLDSKMLRSILSENTRMLLFNTPSSPFGKVFCRSELESIANVVKDFPNLILLADEVYEHMVYDGKAHEHIANIDSMWEKTITVFSVGKTGKTHSEPPREAGCTP